MIMNNEKHFEIINKLNPNKIKFSAGFILSRLGARLGDGVYGTKSTDFSPCKYSKVVKSVNDNSPVQFFFTKSKSLNNINA